jgi:hypothetical protein
MFDSKAQSWRKAQIQTRLWPFEASLAQFERIEQHNRD